MINAKNLSKAFGPVQAVRDVSLNAPDGQITALLGANGAGKTTTLRMIYGLIRPHSGQVSVDGTNPHQNRETVLHTLGVLPDARGLYKNLTARENIDYFGRLQGMKEDRLQQRTEQLIEQLGMQKFAHRRTDGFSQGQRVKVALARALVHDPQNIILDEPTNGLDVMATRGVREFLRQEKARGKCVLFSSHVMQEVSAVCDQIIVIHDGQVCATGTEQELLESTGQANLEDAFVHLVSASPCPTAEAEA